MNGLAPDLLSQINNAVLDIQSANYQTYERPLKTLGRLLKHADLEEINAELRNGLDLEYFLSAGETSGGSFVGSKRLDWPDDPRESLGLSLMLIENFAENPRFLLDFGFSFYHGGTKLDNTLNSVTGRLIIPFARDYCQYVKSKGITTPTLRIPMSKKVFIVHGHDGEARETVARFVSKIGLEPIILHEQANKGRTVIEKVEANSDVGFAIILLTPDDEGRAKKGTDPLKERARQNVLLELGYFLGKLGRDKVCALKKGDVDIPSDFAGVVWELMDDAGGWKQSLARELQAAGHAIDWNTVMR